MLFNLTSNRIQSNANLSRSSSSSSELSKLIPDINRLFAPFCCLLCGFTLFWKGFTTRLEVWALLCGIAIEGGTIFFADACCGFAIYWSARLAGALYLDGGSFLTCGWVRSAGLVSLKRSSSMPASIDSSSDDIPTRSAISSRLISSCEVNWSWLSTVLRSSYCWQFWGLYCWPIDLAAPDETWTPGPF